MLRVPMLLTNRNLPRLIVAMLKFKTYFIPFYFILMTVFILFESNSVTYTAIFWVITYSTVILETEFADLTVT